MDLSSTIKSLTITGAAAQDAMKPRRSTSRKKHPIGGSDENEIIPEPRIEMPLPPKVFVPRQPPVVKPQPPIQQPIEKEVAIQEAGSVILKPPKIQRVKLQPKIQMKHLSQQAPIAHNTRKARRIHMTTANLTHRFTRAKKVRDETGAKPMEAIREFLIGKGVIQMKSKAPEKMLRSMYSDFMLLKDQAL